MNQETRRIDHFSELDGNLSFSGLAVRHWTGIDHSYLDGKGYKAHTYRNGVQTLLGDIRLDIWMQAAEQLIAQSEEQNLLEALISWAATCPWLHSKSEQKEYALELHMARIFDDPTWAGYQEFNNHYRPILQEEDPHEN